MKSIFFKRFISAFLCTVTLICLGSLFGCSRHPKNSPISGGTVDKTDYKAPKVIESKDITGFYASFVLHGEWSPNRVTQAYVFEVKKDESETLTASESQLNISAPADEKLLKALQEVIDSQKLAEQNGVYKVTSGLPYEYQPCTLTVNYASGERLTFTVNNNPDSEWAKKVYLTFANWFAENGNNALLPPEVKGDIEMFRISYKQNGVKTQYTDITVPEENAVNGERNLFGKLVYDYNLKKTVSQDFIVFPDDYYKNISDIVNKYDLRPFDESSVLYGTGRNITENNADGNDLEIYIVYADGHTLSIETGDKKDIEMLKPMLDELMEYCGSLFE